MYLLYSAALAAAAALLFPYFLIQGLRHGKYLRSFRARWGRLPTELIADPAVGRAAESRAAVRLNGGGKGDIWLHAVSVGEVLACPQLVVELRRLLPGR